MRSVNLAEIITSKFILCLNKLFDADSGKELRHIQAIKRVLTAHGFKASQFTATENMADRMELVDAFNKQEISALVAIRCLDEGINIPSIKSALILSSNDDYREFVQRRGRILRTYGNKKYANIYDVIVLPSYVNHIVPSAHYRADHFGTAFRANNSKEPLI